MAPAPPVLTRSRRSRRVPGTRMPARSRRVGVHHPLAWSSMRILLAGTHRCGSTWVANVLGRSHNVVNVYEPDSPETDILGTVTTNRLGKYPALRPGERSMWYSMVWDLAFKGGWPWAGVPS